MSLTEQIQFASISYRNYLFIKRKYYPNEKVMSISAYHRMYQ